MLGWSYYLLKATDNIRRIIIKKNANLDLI